MCSTVRETAHLVGPYYIGPTVHTKTIYFALRHSVSIRDRGACPRGGAATERGLALELVEIRPVLIHLFNVV